MEEKSQEQTAKNGSKTHTDWPWMTGSVDKIATALCKVQAELGTATKRNTNPFFKSNYAALTEIMAVARKPLAKHGIAVTQLTQPCGIDGRTCLVTVLMHGGSGQCISSTYPLNPKASDPQAVGSAVTYARRYALAAILGIVSEGEDDDGEAAQARTFAKPKFKKQEADI